MVDQPSVSPRLESAIGALTLSTIPSRQYDGHRLRWIGIWLLTFLLFAASLSTVEALLRWHGSHPKVPDSTNLWRFWRQRVYGNGGKVIALLGTSRVTADISLQTLRTSLPEYRIVQLGISGAKSSIGILNDLVDDQRFNGTIICELDTPLLERSRWQENDAYRTYQLATPSADLDLLARDWLCERLISIRSDFTLRGLIARWITGRQFPGRDVYSTTFSRETQWDFANVPNLEDFRRTTTDRYVRLYQLQTIPRWTLLSKDAAEVDGMVRRFQSRGGQVVFLRAPSTGERWRLEEQFHSKEQNWDSFAASTTAICIHFRDRPEMAAIRCPDESHLDYRDSPTFTRVLLAELLRRGWRR